MYAEESKRKKTQSSVRAPHNNLHNSFMGPCSFVLFPEFHLYCL